MESADEKLEKLERKLKHTRFILLVLVVLAVAIVLGCWIEATYNLGTVRARAFVVVDENGKSRAGLGITSAGPILRLHDENGKSRIGLFQTSDGAGLSLFDEDGQLRAALGIRQTTTPDGKVITYPESLMFDPNGWVIWSAP